MLQVTDITSGYGQLEIVHGASLHVEAGKVTALLGGNGAGKSTLLNTVVGFVPVRSGTITLEGRSITALSPSETARAGVALVPETRDVFPGLSVEENILLGAYTRRDEAQGGLRRMLTMFPSLADRRALAAGVLSGGEQQMVAIARALVSQPRILLLDEPSLGLGPLIVKALFEVLPAVTGTGAGVLLVEQNVRAALQVADYAYVLERGRMVLEGPAAELAADERVRRAYLGGDVHTT